MIVDIAKQAVPVLLGLYGTKILISKFGGMIPGVSSLGAFTQPALSIGALFLIKFLAKHVGAVAKYQTPLMLGAGMSALDGIIKAIVPSTALASAGLSDYIAVGDYVAVGAMPIDDNIAMSDYIAVGSDGVQEELGLEEELGVEEELGNDMLGGVSSGTMLKQVPGRQFLEPVPARSFTKQIGNAGSSFDQSDALYAGIFRGGY